MRKEMKIYDQRGVTTFWGISIILMEVVVVLFIFYILYFFWIENPTPTENILLVRVFKNQAVTIPSQVETTGWLSYTSRTYGFLLQYPVGYRVAEDDIEYSSFKGHIFGLTKDDKEVFSLRIFPRQGKESIAEAFQRLTGIKPSIYQSFTQEVGGVEAVAYRLDPRQTPKDHVYFLGNGYFFESPLDTFSAQVLATFEFIK